MNMQNNSREKLLILQSYATNYPLLDFINKTMDMPIAIVADNKTQGLSVMKKLSGKPVIIDSSWSVRDVEYAVATTASQAIVWMRPDFSRKSARSQEIEELLFNVAFLNKVGKKDATVPVFIFARRFIEEDLKGKVFEVDLTTLGNDVSFIKEDVVPKEEFVEYIIYELLQKDQGNQHPLEAAATFLKYCKHADYSHVAKQMIEESAESCENEGISHIVLNDIARYIENERLVVHTLSSLRNAEIDKLDNTIIFDDDIMLINESVFKAAVSSLTSSISISTIKRQLEAEHVLLASANGYTRKQEVRTKNYGARIRVMKLDVSNYPSIKSLKY